MANSCAVCGCCTRTDIVREHLEDTLRICDVSAKGNEIILCLCPYALVNAAKIFVLNRGSRAEQSKDRIWIHLCCFLGKDYIRVSIHKQRHMHL